MADTFLKKEELRELLKAATDTSLTYQRINDRVTKMNYEFWDLIKEKDLRIRELEQDLSDGFFSTNSRNFSLLVFIFVLV